MKKEPARRMASGSRTFRGLLGAALLAAGAVVLAAAPAEGRTTVWKSSHWVPATHPLHAILVDWSRSIEAASGGSLRITVIPAQSADQAPDDYAAVRRGVTDVAYLSTGLQAGRMLVSGAGQLPFLIGNAEQGSRAMNEWYRPYAARDLPGVKLCYVFVHDVGTLHSRKEIRRPEQLRGMKVRPAQGMVTDWLRELGARIVQVPATEAATAFEQGQTDAITFPWGSLYGFKVDPHARFHIDAPMYVATFATVINPARYNALDAVQKKALDEHCTSEWAARTARDWARWENEGREKMRAPGSGHTIVRLNDEELAAWKRSTRGVVERYAQALRKAGHDPDKVLGELRSALVKYNAALD